ncbi:MAG TPA: mechanosensitive ion channel family protein [Chthoniobacteraceae bacterium]|jgi:small-conductance mechanosensitive channel|nr:mechanosensitive ion channel family protein [Chthoniobacteraceae bacterium]
MTTGSAAIFRDTLPPDFSWVVTGFLVIASLLMALQPKERPRVRTALKIFGMALMGICAAGGVRQLGLPETSLFYGTFRDAALLLGGIAIVNLAAVAAFAGVLRRVRLEPPPIAQDLLMALGYVVVAIMTLSYVGVNLQGIIATSAVLTAVIGFSLQDSLGNVMGGMVLQLEQTIHVGDWVRVEDVEGRVKHIRWRHTAVETRDWDTIVFPNGVLMKAKVTLLGRKEGAPRQRRRWVYFRVGLDHSPPRVMHAVETALRAETNKHIATEPKPQCLLTDFKDGDAVFAARYWLTDLSQPDPTDSLVRTRIYAALRREGIPLAMPTQEVHVAQLDGSREERQREEDLKRRLDALVRLELFDALTEEERTEIAHRLITAHFVRGEVITRQGAEAHWLYIIAEGDADVKVEHGGMVQTVATLHAGQLFGEMGLMTGEPRTASVIAITEVTCYRLGKEAFEDILHRRPSVAEQMSVILAQRRVELEALRDQLGQQAQEERMRTVRDNLLNRIQSFFSINGAAKV